MKRDAKRQLTGMRMKIFVGTVHEKLRRGFVGECCHGDKITYPFMSFLKIDSVNGLEAARHGFLRIT